MTDTAWIQLIGFLTLIAGGALQYFNSKRQWKERERQRQWDIEDRDLKAKQLEAKVEVTAERLADKVETQASKVASDASEARKELASAIKENTDVSTKAFHEANTVNLKLEELGLVHNASQQEQSDKIQIQSDKLDESTEIAVDTQDRVKKIEAKVVVEGAKRDAERSIDVVAVENVVDVREVGKVERVDEKQIGKRDKK